ncbi:MAG: lysophospholipid acyltransferase family protein [Anaerolineaceae bacterium]
MGIKQFFQDEGSVRLGMWFGRHLSLQTGRSSAVFISRIMASKKNGKMVRNIKTNQWVVSDATLGQQELNQRSQKVLQNIVESLFEYYYYYQHIEEGMQRVQLSPAIQEMITDYKKKKTVQIIVGPHIGNFDLFGMILAKLGLKPYVLSYPNPNNAYKMQNELREAAGIKIAPITFSTYRQAKQALKDGYCLVTGIDRPVENDGDSKYRPAFFGRPANVPTFYVRLALDTGVPVRVACGIAKPDHTFYYDCSEPIQFEKKDNLIEEIVSNAEKVLTVAESYIKSEPEQWAMFYPVWPDVQPILSNSPERFI